MEVVEQKKQELWEHPLAKKTDTPKIQSPHQVKVSVPKNGNFKQQLSD
jgi:hypothetical protein